MWGILTFHYKVLKTHVDLAAEWPGWLTPVETPPCQLPAHLAFALSLGFCKKHALSNPHRAFSSFIATAQGSSDDSERGLGVTRKPAPVLVLGAL